MAHPTGAPTRHQDASAEVVLTLTVNAGAPAITGPSRTPTRVNLDLRSDLLTRKSVPAHLGTCTMPNAKFDCLRSSPPPSDVGTAPMGPSAEQEFPFDVRLLRLWEPDSVQRRAPPFVLLKTL